MVQVLDGDGQGLVVVGRVAEEQGVDLGGASARAGGDLLDEGVGRRSRRRELALAGRPTRVDLGGERTDRGQP